MRHIFQSIYDRSLTVGLFNGVLLAVPSHRCHAILVLQDQPAVDMVDVFEVEDWKVRENDMR
jgi:hypothetical protein